MALEALKEHRKRMMLEWSERTIQREGAAAKGDAAEKALNGEHQRWVFCSPEGTPLRKSNVQRRSFQPILKKSGVPTIRFHDLRHTAATLLLSQGVHPKVVQERLGHSQISLTLDTYSHVLPSMQEEAAAKLHNLLSDFA